MSRCCSALFRLLVFAESDLTGTTHWVLGKFVDDAGYHENARTVLHARRI